MKLTPEQLKQNAEAMIAFADGKPIQRFHNDQWSDYNVAPGGNIPYSFVERPMRPKPEPKTRPWSKPDDVPGSVIWVRQNRSNPGNAEMMNLQGFLIALSTKGLTFFTDCEQFLTWERLPKVGLEYSTDRRTWKPCTVEVSE